MAIQSIRRHIALVVIVSDWDGCQLSQIHILLWCRFVLAQHAGAMDVVLAACHDVVDLDLDCLFEVRNLGFELRTLLEIFMFCSNFLLIFELVEPLIHLLEFQ